MWRVATYEDGSSLWENGMVSRQVPNTVDIQLKIIIGGVTFDDETIERWIDSTDIDQLGEYTFQMIRSAGVTASVCHTIRMYQDGVYLGEAYYAGTLMPNE